MPAPFSLSASMEDKLALLAEQVKSCLDAHGYGEFRLVDRIEKGLLSAGSNEARRSVMGELNPPDPRRPRTRYCRIAYEGRDNDPDLAQSGGAAQVGHRFGVMLWFGYLDTADENASEYQWRRLIESEDAARPGLLPFLSAAGGWQIVSESEVHVVYVGQPQEDMSYLASLDEQQKEFAHYLEFSIVLT